MSRQNNWHNNTQRTWEQSSSNGENQRNYNSNNHTNQTDGGRTNERWHESNTSGGNAAGRTNNLPNNGILMGAAKQIQNETLRGYTVRSTREVMAYNKWLALTFKDA